MLVKSLSMAASSGGIGPLPVTLISTHALLARLRQEAGKLDQAPRTSAPPR